MLRSDLIFNESIYEGFVATTKIFYHSCNFLEELMSDSKADGIKATKSSASLELRQKTMKEKDAQAEGGTGGKLKVNKEETVTSSTSKPIQQMYIN